MTNYDCIKQMNIEQLADFLTSDEFSPCNQCDYNAFRDGDFFCNAPDKFYCTKIYVSALAEDWLRETTCLPASKYLQ